MRSVVVLMTGFALLVAGVLVLALTGATLLGIGLLLAGLLTKIGGVLIGDPAARPAARASAGRTSPARAGGGASRGVTVHARRRPPPVLPSPSASSEQDRRRAS